MTLAYFYSNLTERLPCVGIRVLQCSVNNIQRTSICALKRFICVQKLQIKQAGNIIIPSCIMEGTESLLAWKHFLPSYPRLLNNLRKCSQYWKNDAKSIAVWVRSSNKRCLIQQKSASSKYHQRNNVCGWVI